MAKPVRGMASSNFWGTHRALDFVSEAIEVLVYAPENLTLCWVRSQITDQCGLSGIVAKLFERRLIVPHGLALSGRWAVDPKLLFSPSAVSARDALRSSSSFSAPGGRSAASSRAVLANDARRSCRGNCWLKRRRSIMARSFPFQRKAGAQPAFTSPIRAKCRAVMQDQYPSSKSVPIKKDRPAGSFREREFVPGPRHRTHCEYLMQKIS